MNLFHTISKAILSATMAFSFSAGIAADDTPRPTITPTGRALIDGAAYITPSHDRVADGAAIPEVRLGAKLKYEKWEASIDVSYAYSKIGLRNMWIQYNIDRRNAVRIGNFIHQYGLQSTSSSMKCTMEQPLASSLYTPGLQLGAMFTHYDPRWYVAASAHVESSALKEVMNAPLFNQQGYALLTRTVWRHAPAGSSSFLHIGLSGGFATPQRRVEDGEDIHDGFTMSANFPTKVAQVKAIGTTVDHSMNLFKFTPEIVAAGGRIAFEGQYFFQQINRRDGLRAYRTQSGYATLRTLLTRSSYAYVSSTAQIARPAPGSLELVADYNYSSLTDRRADIAGGRANSMSLTLNYYINPYITARMNFFHTHTWGMDSAPGMTLSGIQARLMVLF